MRARCSGVLSASLAAAILAWPAGAGAQGAPPAIDGDDLGGVVTGPNGPEAGVWVIAETTDLPTRFARMVVTDAEGRFVVPDLPKATYSVWVRGYGLVDSEKVKAEPGRILALTAAPAPSPAAAAHYYPAIYWYSMLTIPPVSEFGGKSDIPAKVTQQGWLNAMKNNGCIGCHQLGQLSTRTVPKSLGPFESSAEAWMRRVQSGQSGEQMVNLLAGELGGVPFKYYRRVDGPHRQGRIAEGETGAAAGRRAQHRRHHLGLARREALSARPHLERPPPPDRESLRPAVRLDRVFDRHHADPRPEDAPGHELHTARARRGTPEALGPGHAAGDKPLMPSPYWGEEKIWNTKANNHNGMFGRDGRVWFAATGRGAANPDFCKKGSEHPSAKLFPLERSNRQITMLDPKTMKHVFVDTCFQTHHPQFGYDANDTLWTSGGGPVVGWLNTKVFDETGDAAKAQGWTALVLDTNGNGRRDDHVEPNAPVDPAKDKRITAGFYAVMPKPGGRLGLGLLPRQSRRRRAARSGRQSAGNGAH